MAFRDTLPTDALNVFANSDEFGEPAVYTPNGGTPISVVVVATRDEEDASPQDRNRAIQKRIKIQIPRGSGTGQVPTITLSKDKISIPEVEGGTAVDWIVNALEERDDPGFSHVLALR